MIRDVQKNDAETICSIYNHYIENSVITFEEKVVPALEMEKRIQNIINNFPWIVYEENSSILGYAYASRWKSRHAYRYSVESTVYLSKIAVGRGIGTKLYQTLIDRLRRISVHTVMGGIALPNQASVALHEKWGLKKSPILKKSVGK
ncbi:GNAT family N-acetyltransferase [Desulfosarcina cetonica]|uniref:GNAT family N-acetyltransferase n=1 Tax=Desulfosarcina cetonica TaxID=90730 RepID=UPI001C462982|nr:GNAT family N-acetyltransferase [Desulfosarcina cetonica]